MSSFNVIAKEERVHRCGHCRDAFADYQCVRCGKTLCERDARECFYCNAMKRPSFFCYDCAQRHWGARDQRFPPKDAMCLRDLRTKSGGYGDDLAMEQRRKEWYKKRGII